MKYRLISNLVITLCMVHACCAASAQTYGTGHKAGSLKPTQADTFTPNYMGDLKHLLHWAKFPVRVVFLNSSEATRRLDDAVMAGFDAWVHATAEGVRYVVVSDSKHADITVTYVPIQQEPITGGELG